MTEAATVWFQVELFSSTAWRTTTMANLRMTLLDLLNKDEQGADPGF